MGDLDPDPDPDLDLDLDSDLDLARDLGVSRATAPHRGDRTAGASPLLHLPATIRFGCMYARWASFAIGIGLMLAPLLVGYGEAAPILHDVAMGMLVCIATLAALEWPLARFVLGAPAVWLLLAGRGADDRLIAAVELVAGALLLVLMAIPSPRLEARAARL